MKSHEVIGFYALPRGFEFIIGRTGVQEWLLPAIDASLAEGKRRR